MKSVFALYLLLCAFIPLSAPGQDLSALYARQRYDTICSLHESGRMAPDEVSPTYYGLSLLHTGQIRKGDSVIAHYLSTYDLYFANRFTFDYSIVKIIYDLHLHVKYDSIIVARYLGESNASNTVLGLLLWKMFRSDQFLRAAYDQEDPANPESKDLNTPHNRYLDASDYVTSDLNAEMMDALFTDRDYPGSAEIGFVMTEIPFYLIHHMDLNSRLRYNAFLLNGAKKGTIAKEQYGMYLARTLAMQYDLPVTTALQDSCAALVFQK